MLSISAILVGGEGDDVLSGANGRDILIGGITAHDANLFALGKILDEWTRSTSLNDRANNLKTGGGFSAGFALNASTVFNDNAGDMLTGGSGKNWFIFGTGDVLADLKNQSAAMFI